LLWVWRVSQTLYVHFFWNWNWDIAQMRY